MPCNAACKKVILNGGVAARVLDEICETIYDFTKDETFSDKDTKELVVMANEIEDRVFKFTRKALEAMGFSGPWPHSLS